MLWTAAAARAQFTCSTNADNTLTILAYAGPGGVVSIPASIGGLAVADIGTNAFAGSSLAAAAIPNGVKNIEDFAFSQCAQLTNAVLPPSLINIASGAFHACTNLAGIQIPAGVTNIGDLAFTYCSSLSSLAIPGSVGRVGQAAFQACANLTNITLAAGIGSLADDAFLGCSSLVHVGIPGSVTNIGQSVFQGCANLQTAHIGAGVPMIGTEMFASCASLRAIVIGDSVTNIGAYAFAGAGLGKVTIPASVAGIESGAFSGTRLANVAISASVTSIGPNAFCICSNLAGITVASSNLFYGSVGGVLFDASQSTLIQYPAGLNAGGIYAIPGSVINIGPSAFAGCGLANIRIPSGVNNIDEDAFHECSGLGILFFEGNAPATEPASFETGTGTVIYYLPGAAGWSSPFGGLAALLWNPAIQTGSADFGASGGQFGFDITGTAGIKVAVQASANLASPAWLPLGTAALAGGLYHFSEPLLTNSAGRFYRLSPP